MRNLTPQCMFYYQFFEVMDYLVHPRFSSSSSSSWAMGTQLLTSHSGTGVSWTNGCWGSGLWNFDQAPQWIMEKMGCYEPLSSQGLGLGYHKARQIFHGLDFNPENGEFKAKVEPLWGNQVSNHEKLLDLWSFVVGVGACNIGHIRKNPTPPQKKNSRPGGPALCAPGSTWKLYGAHFDLRLGGAVLRFYRASELLGVPTILRFFFGETPRFLKKSGPFWSTNWTAL